MNNHLLVNVRKTNYKRKLLFCMCSKRKKKEGNKHDNNQGIMTCKNKHNIGRRQLPLQ